jgi:glycosyltransferase involved in cell wall biosynthesis
MARRLLHVQLVLFFTRGMSVKGWDDAGMLEREVLLYNRLKAHLGQITFVTYGDRKDLGYSDILSGIRIVCNRWKLPTSWYISLITRFYPLATNGVAVFKSNQLRGASVALKAARRCGKRFIVRCGYILSEFAELQHGPDSTQACQARDLEKYVFSSADKVVVSTSRMQHAIIKRYNLSTQRVTVIENYVDTDSFLPESNPPEQSGGRLCFVGRLEQQKNPLALLDAIKGLDVELVVVGNGSLRGQLQAEAERNKLAVQFLGNVPHKQLPEILNSTNVFILPSYYEGHPKTLIEAMACGLPVIGTNVLGIRELIDHGENGYLCGTTPEEIREAIKDVLSDSEARVLMGRKAREFVLEHFSLDNIVAKELALIEELAA